MPGERSLTALSEHACFGGVQGFFQHDSDETGPPMRFGVYVPAQAKSGPVPAPFYLAGLTCNQETFAIKAGAQRHAAVHGLMIVTPDTSPRDTGIEGADTAWDFGTAAFAPIAALMHCCWGVEAFGGYLGYERAAWARYDATALVQAIDRPTPGRQVSRRSIAS